MKLTVDGVNLSAEMTSHDAQIELCLYSQKPCILQKICSLFH